MMEEDASAYAKEDDYGAYLSDQENQPSTSCGVETGSSWPYWMSKMGPKYFRLKLGEVIWPGTHDSGAYCQEFDYSKVVHHDTLRKVGTHLLYCLGPVASGVASKWSQTQSLSIKEQLEHGARYLDLRISRCLEDGCYYIVHSFCGPNIEEVFRQISEFMSQHPQECLLLEVDPVSHVDCGELHTLFDRRLGPFLLKRENSSLAVSPMSLTLSHLVQKGRIVVLYKFPAQIGSTSSLHSFWDNGCIYAPFVMSLDPAIKEGHQLEQFLHFSSNYHQDVDRKHHYLFHFMYALTPHFSDIVKSVLPRNWRTREDPGNLQECSKQINPRIAQFMVEIKKCIESEDCTDMGLIFSVDFIGDSNLMNHIIELNQQRSICGN